MFLCCPQFRLRHKPTIKCFISHILSLCHDCSNSLKCCSVLPWVSNQESPNQGVQRESKPRIPRVDGRSGLCQEQGQSPPCEKLRLVLKSLRGRQKCSYHNLQQAKATDTVTKKQGLFHNFSILSNQKGLIS